jgi:hypothetical protein
MVIGSRSVRRLPVSYLRLLQRSNIGSHPKDHGEREILVSGPKQKASIGADSQGLMKLTCSKLKQGQNSFVLDTRELPGRTSSVFLARCGGSDETRTRDLRCDRASFHPMNKRSALKPQRFRDLLRPVSPSWTPSISKSVNKLGTKRMPPSVNGRSITHPLTYSPGRVFSEVLNGCRISN